MTDVLSVAALLSRIPGISSDSATYRALNGGLTNRTFLVQADHRALVLRIAAEHTRDLGLDRATELSILRSAASRGLAPQVVFADADAGVLLYEYVSGRVWTAADLANTSNLEALAQLMRSVHELPESGVVFDALSVAERYATQIRRNDELYAFAVRCVNVIKDIPPPSNPVCCHNDIVAANIVATPTLRLLDWEYACDNEPLFDLAVLVGYHELGEEQVATLSSAYCGSGDAEVRERLQQQLRLYLSIEWLWFAVRYVVSPDSARRDRLKQLAQRVR